MFIGVRPGSLEIVAGATASVNISIVDTDATPVAQPVRVAVLGPPDGWVTFDDATPTVPASGSVGVTATVSVPADHPSGEFLFVVAVTSVDAGGREVYERLPVTVVERPSVRVTTDSSIADGGRRSRVGLVVTSDAASPVIVAPVARDPRGALEVSFERSRVEIEPGAMRTLGVSITGDRPVAGRPRRSIVTLGVNAGTDVTIDVLVVRRPVLGFIALLLVALALVAASAGIVLAGGLDRFRGDSEPAVVDELVSPRPVEAARTPGAVMVAQVRSAATGQAVVGARVEALAASDPVVVLAAGASDADGVARVRGVPTGDIVLRATAPGFETVFSGGVSRHGDAVAVSVAPSDVAASTRLELADLVMVGEVAEISGRVIGAEEGTFEVLARPVVDAPTARVVTGVLDRTAFRLSGLAAPAEYDLVVRRGGEDVLAHRLSVGAGERVDQVLLTVLGADATVTGTVSGPLGPVGGAEVIVGDGTVQRRTVSLTEGAVGSFSIGGLGGPATYNVTVRADALATETASVSVTAGGSASVDVELAAATGSIAGRVVNTDGVGVGGVVVRVTADGVQRTAVSVDGSGEDAGRFRVEGLALPGDYSVTVAPESGRAAAQQVQISREVPRRGDLVVRVVPATSSVTGTVVTAAGTPVAGAQVTLSDGVRVVRTMTVTAPAGVFGMGDVAPGRYTLSVERRGATTEVVEVTVPDTIVDPGPVVVDVTVGAVATVIGTVERAVPVLLDGEGDDDGAEPEPVIEAAAGLTVRLHRVPDAAGPASTAVAVATTASDGTFTLTDFSAPVDYVVVIVDPVDPTTVLSSVSVRPSPGAETAVDVPTIDP